MRRNVKLQDHPCQAMGKGLRATHVSYFKEFSFIDLVHLHRFDESLPARPKPDIIVLVQISDEEVFPMIAQFVHQALHLLMRNRMYHIGTSISVIAQQRRQPFLKRGRLIILIALLHNCRDIRARIRKLRVRNSARVMDHLSGTHG